MEICVLGALEARERDTDIVPTAGKVRQVLSLLALHPGQVVTVSALMEELWGEDPPRSAPTTLQTYVLQLRRKLDAALRATPVAGPAPIDVRRAKDVLVTKHVGYQLSVAPDVVDVCGFDRLAAAGRVASDSGDAEAASRLLGQALSIWRGPALIDVQHGPRLQIEVLRLQEARLSALECRIDADLSLGRHQVLLGELAVLCAQHPLHENLHARYMLALYRAGRQWQALDVFGRVRSTLVEELGVEPSSRLQTLQRDILNSEPHLERLDADPRTRAAV
ncbi:MAG: AfsR/SARP family transcriptional regulator [Kineosporiaceae bacterium]